MTEIACDDRVLDSSSLSDDDGEQLDRVPDMRVELTVVDPPRRDPDTLRFLAKSADAKPAVRLSVTPVLQRDVWERYNRDAAGQPTYYGACVACQTRICCLSSWAVSHGVPVASGGTTELDNLYVCCVDCNMHMKTTELVPYIVLQRYDEHENWSTTVAPKLGVTPGVLGNLRHDVAYLMTAQYHLENMALSRYSYADWRKSVCVALTSPAAGCTWDKRLRVAAQTLVAMDVLSRFVTCFHFSRATLRVQPAKKRGRPNAEESKQKDAQTKTIDTLVGGIKEFCAKKQRKILQTKVPKRARIIAEAALITNTTTQATNLFEQLTNAFAILEDLRLGVPGAVE